MKNYNIKTSVILAAMLGLTTTTVQAQDAPFRTNWNVATGNWNVNASWLSAGGNPFVPAGPEFGEYASISNGGIATLDATDGAVPMPAFVMIGEEAGESGTLNVSGGTLTTSDSDLLIDGHVYREFIVVGGLGSGILNQSGGTINTSSLTVGLGGGTGGTLNITGGALNVTTGDFNLGDNGGGIGTFNMSSGTLNAAADWDIGGTQSALTGAQGHANISGNSAVTIANRIFVGLSPASNASLTIRDSASVTAGAVELNSSSVNHVLMLQDNASLIVQNNINITSTLKTVGNTASMSVGGDFNISGTGIYNPVISDATTHSVVNVTGNIRLGGTLKLDFDGVVPALNDKWTLMSGNKNIIGNFDKTIGEGTSKGVHFQVQKDGGDVNVVLENALTFSMNTASGRADIVDYNGGVEIVSYVLKSNSNKFDLNGLNSISASGATGWEEANLKNGQISEIALLDTKTFGTGESHNLGEVLMGLESSTPFGQSALADGEFTMQYRTAAGHLTDAILEIEGTHNNLVLTVDPATGGMMIQNHSTKTVDLVSYVLSSEAGAFDVNTWNSLEDQSTQGWDEANGTVNQLSELNLEDDMTLTPGQTFVLGNGWTTGSDQDVEFKFRLNDEAGSVMDGVVEFADLPTLLEGDFDFNGLVNEDDLAIVKAGFGDNYGLEQLAAVRNNFGASSVVAIPEPSSIFMLILSAAGLARRKRI